MATYGWGTNTSVEAWLFAEGYRFNFYQAVKLLELIRGLELNHPARFLSKAPLFSIEPSFQSELDETSISEAFAIACRRNGVSLYEGFSILIEQRGRQWHIIDNSGKSTHTIVTHQDRLGVYVNRQTPLQEILVGVSDDPSKEAVRFASNFELGFSGTQIQWVKRAPSVNSPADMLVNFIGLGGPDGPLPLTDTNVVLERSHSGDTTLRDFLNIFNHRLTSLLYRVRQTHRVAFDFTWLLGDESDTAEIGTFSSYLFDLIGLGTPNLRKNFRKRMEIDDCSLLYYAGLLTQHPRSAVGLVNLLSDYFGIEVDVRQFCGQWFCLDDDQVTRIGDETHGQHQALGTQAYLGTRVLDVQSKFELRLGPLTLTQFCLFLPIGCMFAPLCDLTQFYVGQNFDFDICLILDAAQVPPSRLGPNSSTRLGWTSWLKEQPMTRNVQVRLSPVTGKNQNRQMGK